MSDRVQTTFAGTGIDTDHRPYPRTFVFCEETGQPVLRSRRGTWPHATTEDPPWEEEEDEDDEAELAGKFFDVEISVEQTYRFRIPAYSDHEAKEVANDWRLDAKPADSMVLHTRVNEQDREIYEDSPHLPEDFDIYGGERLADVWIDDADDEEADDEHDDLDEQEIDLDVPWAVVTTGGEQ